MNSELCGHIDPVWLIIIFDQAFSSHCDRLTALSSSKQLSYVLYSSDNRF